MPSASSSAPRQLLRDCALLLLLAAIPALLACWLHPKQPAWSWHQPGATEVTLGEVTRWPPPILWVDARSAEAYQKQHVPGAIPLNEDAWESLFPGFIEVWRPGAKVIVYCDSQACDASQAV